MKNTPEPKPAAKRNPSSPVEALIEVDIILADIVPLWSRAHRQLVELQHGHSGRPAGNGEPGGGSGAVLGDTVVERVVLGRRGEDQVALGRLLELPVRVESSTVLLARALGRGVPSPSSTVSPVRRLVWSRWAVRTVLDANARRVLLRRIPQREVSSVYGAVCELGELVDRWSADPRVPPPSRERGGLAVDNSGLWCTSCLRAGELSPRSDRYPTLGLCRWCGDFHAGVGFLPTHDLIDARRDGRRITEAMVAASRPVPAKKRRKKR